MGNVIRFPTEIRMIRMTQHEKAQSGMPPMSLYEILRNFIVGFTLWLASPLVMEFFFVKFINGFF